MDLKLELDLAVRASRAAGGRLAAATDADRLVLGADGKDIKLAADREAEAMILEMLSASSPYSNLSEESGLSAALGADPYWVVDPLDGTMNFSRGIPFACVSIALALGEEPLLGVIHDFYRDETFSAIPGVGAWLNGAPIAVSKIETSASAVLASGFPTNRDYAGGALAGFIDRVQRFKKIRFLGSAALSLAYVAAGRADAYAEEGIMFWDVAAGVALVRAAGGAAEISDPGRMPWARDVRAAASPIIWK